ncbi:MAG TPA: pallilysin-related adhesin, partial [Spirochaetia bacterium]|nr:pallilysin-related adhesin [Spirochaetia bacterium]
EIVASGMNSAGKLTIDIFRPVTPAPGKELTYKPICQLVADEISIEETDRAESYSTDPKPGPSFPVVAYLRDPDSQNVMDLIRIRYAWNPGEGRYVPGPPEKIPGEKVQQTQLETLYNSGGEDVFEQFIAGSWVQLQPSKDGKGPAAIVSIITFDPRGRKIALSSGNTQEVYLWRESHRTIYNSLLALGENETVLEIHLANRFTITVDSVNSIIVNMGGRDSEESRTVRFTKVTDEIQSELIGRLDAQLVMGPLTLSGSYVGNDGLSLDFDGSQLTWTTNGQHQTGSFVLFSLGARTLLSMRVSGPRGTPDQISSWLVDFHERKDSLHIVRTLGLSPVLLTVKGYEEAKGDALALEQIEELKKK